MVGWMPKSNKWDNTWLDVADSILSENADATVTQKHGVEINSAHLILLEKKQCLIMLGARKNFSNFSIFQAG